VTRYRLHRRASDELTAAARWYAERSPAAALRFVAAIEQAIRRIVEAPEAWPRRGDRADVREAAAWVLARPSLSRGTATISSERLRLRVVVADDVVEGR
jgi:plasmid stabilization system protein ParE